VIIHEWFDVNLWQGELARASDSEAPTCRFALSFVGAYQFVTNKQKPSLFKKLGF
jgi:hypothetical protein